ncbi:hypothetical protein RJT34_09625 [Clitoria ternatea]|uniref:Uncharacterized protein n=1 Tax=Clitoria ternatea TaxID=43366 RepID=A0AAN9PUR2_CLITE
MALYTINCMKLTRWGPLTRAYDDMEMRGSNRVEVGLRHPNSLLCIKKSRGVVGPPLKSEGEKEPLVKSVESLIAPLGFRDVASRMKCFDSIVSRIKETLHQAPSSHIQVMPLRTEPSPGASSLQQFFTPIVILLKKSLESSRLTLTVRNNTSESSIINTERITAPLPNEIESTALPVGPFH